TLEFFVNDGADPSGSGEGKTFVGQVTVNTNGSGLGNYSFALLSVVAVGTPVSATATGADGDTSEFSRLRNATMASISGTVFDDLDGDGVRDSGEPGLGSATAFIDANNDGKLGDGETNVTSSSSGSYRFSNLNSGTYRVRLDVPNGRRLTTPGTASFNITLAAGEQSSSNVFGSTTMAILRGTVFEDTDGDGVKDANEQGMEGVIVFIDKDNDGVFDAAERSRVTTSTGAYRFTNLAPGTYNIRIAPTSGFSQTAPPGGLFRLTVVAGQSLSNRNFGQEPV
ncbi:MAG: SdrD B-like domain-containing protein, partial [Tepidisphaeraceae bacterium]